MQSDTTPYGIESPAIGLSGTEEYLSLIDAEYLRRLECSLRGAAYFSRS